MQYRIRPVQETDLRTVVQMCREHASYEGADYVENDQESKLRLALFSEPRQLECWVVAAEEGLIGYTSFMMQFSTWDAAYYLYMDCLFLRPEARGLGIGTAIMASLRQLAAERGCINIQWQTPVFNEGAIRFYERLGAVAKAKQRFIWSST